MNVRSSRPCSRFALVILLVLAISCPVSAIATTTLDADAITLPGGIALRQVHSTLQLAGDGQLQLSLVAAQADIPKLGWRRVRLALDGKLAHTRQDHWSWSGTVLIKGAPGGLMQHGGSFKLILDIASDTLELDLARSSRQSVQLAMPLDQTTHLQVHLVRMPLAWIQGFLLHAWKGKITSGQVTGVAAMDFQPDGMQASASLHADNVGFDGGALAGQALKMDGHLTMDAAAKRNRFSLAATLNGGQVLVGPIYAQLPAHPVSLGFKLETRGESLRVDHLRFSDPDALVLSGGFIFGTGGTLHSMNISHFNAIFPAAYARYGKTWLDTLGLRDLHSSGNLSGTLQLAGDGLRSFALQTDELNLDDGSGRFRVQGLQGGLDWNRKGSLPVSGLQWKQLGIYRIPFGASSSKWQSRNGTLRLLGPLDIPVLGGQLNVNTLAIRPQGGQGESLDMATSLTDVDMGALSEVLGWPRFHGTLAGAMPGLHYAGGRFDLQGGLSLNVFDGFVDITRLSLTHPFGGTPEIAADVSLSKLNLGAMTDVFDFGKITGDLQGQIKQLHLVDWQPVGFDAHLLADSGGRISQRAVNNLTSVGGGGVAGGLQGAILKLFKSFRYDRIGINCTLEGSVCHMSGLEPDNGGYLIVDGSGLPHLTVIGHQKRVSWPTLLTRLEAAIHGGGPVVK
ncbi:hypothetical protein [Oleiagrimonas sp.]|jgi:hypothetical protein|uniref:hypothetical protein n=1 Tax=Oleiagrimonas sp. TaxID=2010330 RepID=UPI00261BEDCD|nr:hypothetical protein [Oleiagrimonas sp.]MDA3914631.1 hypothetical protein [Oleiagrimonas sp.]